MTCNRRNEQVWKAPSPQRPRVRMRMGLYTSCAIAHKHHGEISVESEVGAGTTFTVGFPITSRASSDNQAKERMPIVAKKDLSGIVSTIDFHVTCECNQECVYCWGPQDIENPVDTATALAIIDRIKEVGAKRVVFTGGDPLKRQDIATLIDHAKEIGLEVAVSTTGDELTPNFLERIAAHTDLISIPLDGPSEAVNEATKKPGHFTSVMRALAWLRAHPEIDVKLCTPVTRHNIRHVPVVAHLASHYAGTTQARVFYNVFQAYPRAIREVDWGDLLVSDEDFERLKTQVQKGNLAAVNFLDHAVLDGLYLMVFPDGRLVIPRGSDFPSYGDFLDIDDFEAVINDSRFDSAKHIHHSKAWQRPANK
jgi:sulfatase maturation enzyme AslB (radical SAM superfamily)